MYSDIDYKNQNIHFMNIKLKGQLNYSQWNTIIGKKKVEENVIMNILIMSGIESQTTQQGYADEIKF